MIPPIQDDDSGRFDDDEPVDSSVIAYEPAFRLVKAQLSAHEENPSSRFHLRLTLGCSSGTLDGADSRYEVNLRQCNVHVITEGCVVDLSDAYSYRLPETVITEQYEVTSREHRHGSSEGRVGGNVKSSPKNLFGFMFALFGFMFGGNVSRKAETKKDVSHLAKGTRRIMLISCNGEYWTVGDDEYGDPRNSRGRLRERYFNEERDKPLCAIDVKRGTGVAKVTIQVRARFGHLDVDLLDDWGRRRRTAGPEYITDIGRSLRDRLKGIALAKTIRNQQLQSYPALPPSEFLLEQRRLFAHMPRKWIQLPRTDKPE